MNQSSRSRIEGIAYPLSNAPFSVPTIGVFLRFKSMLWEGFLRGEVVFLEKSTIFLKKTTSPR